MLKKDHVNSPFASEAGRSKRVVDRVLSYKVVVSSEKSPAMTFAHSATNPENGLGQLSVLTLTRARLSNLAETVVEEIVGCIHLWGHDAVLFSGAAGDTVAAGGTCTYQSHNQ